MTSPQAPAPASAEAERPVAPEARPAWSRVWSKDAALRALRVTLVVPSLFAVADLLFGNIQMATYAAFGGFATLVMSSSGGTRRSRTPGAWLTCQPEVPVRCRAPMDLEDRSPVGDGHDCPGAGQDALRQSGLGPDVRVPGRGEYAAGVSMKISAALIQL